MDKIALLSYIVKFLLGVSVPIPTRPLLVITILGILEVKNLSSSLSSPAIFSALI